MYIDNHCHLTDDRFDADLDLVVQRASHNQVEKIIIPTTFPGDIAKAQKIAETYTQVFFLAGVHPEEVNKIEIEEALSVVKAALNHPKCVGVGEIGLDFFYDQDKETAIPQTYLFQKQLEIALDADKPVVIHSRKAVEETRQVLSQLKGIPRGQFHCWGESEDFLQHVLSLGFYVSFCGNLTFKNAQNLRDLCPKVPLNKLLLETDSPYLAPEGHRGERNEPANVKILADAIGQLLGEPGDEIGRKTSDNSRQLFLL